MSEIIRRDEQYKVTVHLAKNGAAYVFDAKVSFWYNPDQYGNGYYMDVESKEEPFGSQSYDIRYDRDFNPDYLIEYIVNFYSRRFDGKKTEYDTKWKLTGIRVYEFEEV